MSKANIKIYEEIWFVKKLGTMGSVDEDLAYLCHVTKDAAFAKRQDTGRRWGGRYNDTTKPPEKQVPNVPMKGFKLGKSVTRWSTDNKVFRLEDPRGFVVEISTGNLEMLMRDTTIIKGVIQEECIWGRDTNNILVSVNSQPYLDSYCPTDVTIPLKNISVGDKVRMQNGKNYVYAGNIKPTFQIPIIEDEHESSGWRTIRKEIVDYKTIEGEFRHFFLEEDKHQMYNPLDYSDIAGRYTVDQYTTFSSPKISTIISQNNPIGNLATGYYGDAYGNIPIKKKEGDSYRYGSEKIGNIRTYHYDSNRKTISVETK